MLLLQSENDRSYYLMIAVNSDGHLQFEEDREGTAYGAKIERNFINNARHSVYYERNHNSSSLMIDREIVELAPVQVLQLTQVVDIGANEVQIGGLNTSDPRFAVFKSYMGCLSSKRLINLSNSSSPSL